jgi:hypothetical protein
MEERSQRDAERRDRASRITGHAATLFGRVIATTFPIYQATDRGSPDAWGSGVLLELGPGRFVLSATHVIRREQDCELRIATGEELSPLKGERLRILREGAEHPGDDDIDVTVIRVNDPVWAFVPSESFAQWSDIDHSAIRPTRDSFALTGYPITKQRNSVKGENVSAFAYRALGKECPLQSYHSERRDPETSIMLGMEKKRMWGPEGHMTAPDMYGISGSGLWRFGPNVMLVTSEPKLSGIVVEWKKKGRNQHILGTRIRTILAAVAMHWDDVQRFIEAQVGRDT